MSKYPAQIDNSTTLPLVTDKSTPVTADTVNRLRNTIIAIESELGIKPSNIYSTVRARLDALNTIIDNLEVIELDKDLGGTLENPIVTGIQGKPVSTVPPTVGQILIWDGIAWSPSIPVSGAPSGIAGGNLGGTYPNPSVIKLQGTPIKNISPLDGYMLTYIAADGYWEPKPGVSSFSAGGDLIGTNSSQQVISLTGSGGTVTSSATTISINPNIISPIINQARQISNIPCNDLTITSQAAYVSATGSNTTAGNLILRVPADGYEVMVNASLRIEAGGSIIVDLSGADTDFISLGGHQLSVPYSFPADTGLIRVNKGNLLVGTDVPDSNDRCLVSLNNNADLILGSSITGTNNVQNVKIAADGYVNVSSNIFQFMGGIDGYGGTRPSTNALRDGYQTTNGSANQVMSTVTPSSGQQIRVLSEVMATRTDVLGDAAWFLLKAVYLRNGGSLVVVKAPSIVDTGSTAGASTWTAQLAANGTAIETQITGQAGKIIHWSIVREFVEAS